MLLAGLAVVAGRRPQSPRDIPVRQRWFILAGAGTNLVLNLAMFIAFVRIEIGLALLLFYLFPAIVAMASVLWFDDRLDTLRWTALGVSMLGLALTLAGAGGFGALDPLGIGLWILAAFAQAFYVLAARHGFPDIQPIEAAATTMGLATFGYVVIAIVIGQVAALGVPLQSSDALVAVMAAGLVGAAVPTLCFITGIRLLGVHARPSSPRWSRSSGSPSRIAAGRAAVAAPIDRGWVDPGGGPVAPGARGRRGGHEAVAA